MTPIGDHSTRIPMNNTRPGGTPRRWRSGEPPAELSAPPHLDRPACIRELPAACSRPEMLADRFRWLCEPYSFSEVARLTGLNPETIRRMVHSQGPSIAAAVAICAAGNISPLWLLFGINPVWTDNAEAEAAIVAGASTRRLVVELVRRAEKLDRAGAQHADALHEPPLTINPHRPGRPRNDTPIGSIGPAPQARTQRRGRHAAGGH